MRNFLLVSMALAALGLVAFLVFASRQAPTDAPPDGISTTTSQVETTAAPNVTIAPDKDAPKSLLSERAVVAAAAESPPAATSWPRALVFGRIVDDAGQPVAGVTVRFSAVDGPWAEGQTVPIVEHGRWKVEEFGCETKADGNFRFDVPLPTSKWIALHLEPPIYFGLGGRDFGEAGGRNQPPIHAGDNDLGDILLPATGAASGEVRAADGGPIEAAEIRLEGVFPGDRGVQTESDAGGHFTLGHVPEGSFTVRAFKEGFLARTTTGVEVHARSTTNGLSFALERAPTISGRVVDDAGQPVAKVRIQGWPVRSGQGVGARTKEDGSFSVFLPQNDPYSFAIEDPNYEHDFGQERKEAIAPGRTDVLIVAKRVQKVMFVVLDDATGAPLERYGLGIGHDPSGSFHSSDDYSDVPPSAHPQGECTIAADPGKNTVRAQAAGHEPIETAVAFDVGADRRQTLRLKKGAELAGRATHAGKPIARPTVMLERAFVKIDATQPDESAEERFFSDNYRADLSEYLGRRRSTAGTDDGSFRVEDLAAGTYKLVVSGPNVAPRTIAEVHVDAGSVKDLGEIALDVASGVRGKIVMSSGVSPVGLQVVLDEDWAREFHVVAKDGAFAFPGIAAGKHKLTLEPSPPVLLRPETLEFEVAAGETKDVVFDVSSKAPCTLHVRVTRSGKPVAGMSVEARILHGENGGWDAADLGTTGESGRTGGEVPAGGELVLAAKGSNGLVIGRSDPLVPTPHGVHEVEIALVTATVVVVLPETFKLPEAGALSVQFERGGEDQDRFTWLQIATAASPFRMNELTWTGRRCELGEIGAGDYDVTIDASKFVLEESTQGSSFKTEVVLGPFRTKLALHAGESKEIVVTP